MSLERGKPVLPAFQKGSPHGKFNSLYGTGDHPSEGGKIVDGVDGKIHIMGDDIEDAIMKIHPKEGEYILTLDDDIKTIYEKIEDFDSSLQTYITNILGGNF